MMKWYRLACLLFVISVHLYSAEQSSVKRSVSIRMRRTPALLLMYNQKVTKAEDLENREKRDLVPEELPKFLIKPRDLQPPDKNDPELLVKAERVSHRLDLKTARSSGNSSTSSRSSSAASTPERSPSTTPRIE
ncbi:MAG: hypothetical protein ACHQVS_04110 [Candidatus Babeliales bacterium]